MTLTQLARDHRRRWTAVLLGVLAGTAAAVGYVLLAPTSYEATSRLFVTSTARSADGQLVADAATATQQVRSYARLATSDQVLTAVIANLSLPVQPADLAARVSASAEPGTVFIDLSARDESPARARDIANAVATQLPVAIADVDGITPGVELAVTTAAVLPTSPADPRPLRSALLGVGAGASVGLLAAIALSLRDNRFRNRRDVLAAVSLPVLAELPAMPGHRLIATEQQGGNRLSEGFRRLRTHLLHLTGDGGPGVVLVTSADESAGRSSVAIGLALALEDSGIETVLVDADLRRPAIARAFGLDPAPGLTSLLTGAASIADVVRRPWPAGPRVIASGPPVTNPGDLVGSPRMAEVVRSLADGGLTVVIDAPAVGGVADAMAMVRFVDGVLLAVRAGRTRREELMDAVGELRSLDARVLGVALVAAGGSARRTRPSLQPAAASGQRLAPAPVLAPVPTLGQVPATAAVAAPVDARVVVDAPAPMAVAVPEAVAARITPPDTLAAAVESMVSPVELRVESPFEDGFPESWEQQPESELLAETRPLSSDEIPDGDHVQWFDLADVGAARAPQWEPVPLPVGELPVDELPVDEPADDEQADELADDRDVVAAGWTTWEIAVADEGQPEYREIEYRESEYGDSEYTETQYGESEYDRYEPDNHEADHHAAAHHEADQYAAAGPRQDEAQFDAFLRPRAEPAAPENPDAGTGFAYRYQPEVPAPTRSIADLPRPSPNLEPITAPPAADWGSPWNEAPRPAEATPQTSWMHRIPSREVDTYEPQPYAQNASRSEWSDGSDALDEPDEPGEEPDSRHEAGRHAMVSTDRASLPSTTAMALDAIRAQQITPGRRRR